jgi:hypothetical protein
MTIVVIKLYHYKDRNRRVTYIYERLAIVLLALTCYRQRETTSGSPSSPTNESDSPSIETPNVIEAPPDFKHPLKRRLSLKTISPDCSFASTSKNEFDRSRGRSKAWDSGGALCSSEIDRKLSWELVSCAVDRFCLLVFILLRLILAVIFLTILSVRSS